MITKTTPRLILRIGCLGLVFLLLVAWLWALSVALDVSTGVQARSERLAEKPRRGGIFEALTTQPITVTNSTDVTNGDTSSVLSLIASPGPDGISFREALVASNNTPGAETIEFSPLVAGASIYILPQNSNWPVLTGGGLTINGDIDRNGTPDITLDGSLSQPDTPTSNALSIWSDNNTITGLSFKHFKGTAILFGVPDFYNGNSMTVAGNKIISNTIEDSVISVSPFGWVDFDNSAWVSDLTWQDTLIAGNHLTSTMKHTGGIGLIAGGRTSQRNRILNATITGNTLKGYGVAIMVFAADTNSRWSGMPGPIRYADDNLIQNILVANNVIEDIEYKGIEIAAGNMGNSGNQVQDVTVRHNYIHGGASLYDIGITIITAGEGDVSDRQMTGNVISGLDVHGNQIENAQNGIKARACDTLFTTASPDMTQNRLESVKITDNSVLQSGDSGIIVFGGMSNSDIRAIDNVVSDVVIRGNDVFTATQIGGGGIFVLGGWVQNPCSECARNNSVEKLTVSDNHVRGYEIAIRVLGGAGSGAVSNVVKGAVRGNLCTGYTYPNEFVADYKGALDNILELELLYYLRLPFIRSNASP